MWEQAKNVVKRMSKKGGSSLLFHIDAQPRKVGEVVEPTLEGWVLDLGGLELSLYLCLDDRPAFLLPIDLPRLDIYRQFPKAKNSLLSGFSVALPYHLLKDISDSRVSLRVVALNYEQTIWKWQNPIANFGAIDPDATTNVGAGGLPAPEETRLQALVAALARQGLSLVGETFFTAPVQTEVTSALKLQKGITASLASPDLELTAGVLVVFYSSGSLPLLKGMCHWLGSELLNAGNQLPAYVKVVVLASGSCDQSTIAASLKLVEQEQLSLGSLGVPFSIVVEREGDCNSWKSLFARLAIDRSGLVLSIAEGVGLDGLRLLPLLRHFQQLGKLPVLMPTPIGGQLGVQVKLDINLRSFYECSSVDGRDLPALFPVRTLGPVWLTTTAFLEALEREMMPKKLAAAKAEAHRIEEADQMSSRCLVVPPADLLTYYLDLRQFIEPGSFFQAWLTESELRDMRDVFSVHVHCKKLTESLPAPGKNGQQSSGEESKKVYFFSSSNWLSGLPSKASLAGSLSGSAAALDYGKGFQEKFLYEALIAQGHNVLVINEQECEQSALPVGVPVAPFDEMSRKLSLADKGLIIVTEWRSVRGAFALSYLTGSPVVFFMQENATLRYEFSQRDNRELARFAYRSNCLPLVNSVSVISALADELDGFQEIVKLPPVVNGQCFSEYSLERKQGSVLLLMDQMMIENQAVMNYWAEALPHFTGNCPGGSLGIVFTDCYYASQLLMTQLLPGVDFFLHSCSSAPDFADTYSRYEIVVDCRDGFTTPLELLEAGACGAALVISGSPEWGLQAGCSCLVAENSSPRALLAEVGRLVADGELLANIKRDARKVANQYVVSADLVSSRESPWANVVDNLLKAHEQMTVRLAGIRSRRKAVTIVVPVYNALDALSLCLRRLCEFLPDGFKVILVDDGCDEGTVAWMMEFCSRDGRFTLVQQERNQGFVQACIAGVSAAPSDHDIILLNSDVAISRYAIQSLQDAAYSRYNVLLASSLSTHSPHLQVDLNPGDSLDIAARRLQEVVKPLYPTIITAEGQFLYIRRVGLEKFGFFDEAYGRGYCEESDMCLRMFLHGGDMVVADNSLILHRHAASFGLGEKKKALSRNRQILDSRWGRYYYPIYGEFLSRNPLGEVRAFYHSLVPNIEPPKEALLPSHIDELFVPGLVANRSARYNCKFLDGVKVVFILPSVVLGGGTLSVLQHVEEMQSRGINARVLTLQKTSVNNRPYLAPALVMTAAEIANLDWTSQRVVATFWTTAYLVKAITMRHPETKGYYYVQDYEPWFYSRPDDFHLVNRAEKSYELGLQAVAKTDYLRKLVNGQHKVDIQVINPGIDQTVFYPGKQNDERGRVRLVAMYRPETRRRGTKEIIELFQGLKQRLPEVDISVFGSEEADLGKLQGFVDSRGILAPVEVAKLYRASDILIDLSYWHGFGRMGLEAMACGAVPILSKSGGVDRYAVDGENAYLVDPEDVCGALNRVILLCLDRRRRLAMRQRALDTATRFSEGKATDDWLRILGLGGS